MILALYILPEVTSARVGVYQQSLEALTMVTLFSLFQEYMYSSLSPAWRWWIGSCYCVRVEIDLRYPQFTAEVFLWNLQAFSRLQSSK